MSAADGYQDEMGNRSNISDSDFDRILAGNEPQGGEPTADVARFVEGMRDAHPRQATDHLEADHVARMMAALPSLAETGDPATRPVDNARTPAEQGRGLSQNRSVPEMLKNAFATWWAKAAAVALAVLVSTAGAAFAGVLPSPLQHAAFHAAAAVGVDIPAPTAAPEATPTESTDATEAPDVEAVDTTDTESVDATEAPEVDNQDGDHQGDNADETDANTPDESATSQDASDEQDAADAPKAPEAKPAKPADNGGDSTDQSADQPEGD